jgi:hypothetical protein
MSIRTEGEKLLGHLNELRNQLPSRLSDRRRVESVEYEPFGKRGVSQFLAKAEPVRSTILQFLDRLGLSDSLSCRNFKQLRVWPWAGPAEGIERPLIIQHFHRWLDLGRDAVRFGFDFIPSRKAVSLRTTSERTLSQSGVRDGERARPPVLPLEKLKEKKSIRQAEAAHSLGGISTRMVRKMEVEGKLTKGKSGRILIDEKFEQEYKNRHSPAPK